MSVYDWTTSKRKNEVTWTCCEKTEFEGILDQLYCKPHGSLDCKQCSKPLCAQHRKKQCNICKTESAQKDQNTKDQTTK